MHSNLDLHSILLPRIQTRRDTQRAEGLWRSRVLRQVRQWIAGSLALFGLLAGAHGEGAAPRDAVPDGTEHYHHEYYSHSSVDPNYREGQEEGQQPPASSSISKAGPHGSKSKTRVTIALGGHRIHHQQ
jgi:hypothetical protein